MCHFLFTYSEWSISKRYIAANHVLVWGGIEQYRKIWDDIYKMVLISSISFSAVLGNMVREYLSLNLIFLIFLINMGAIFLRMYLSKKKNKFIL